MRTIAYYVSQWLQLSDGFVYSQVQRSRDRGIVISRDGWENLEAYPYKPRYSLHRRPVPGRLKTAALPAQLVPLLALTRAELVHVHFGYAANDVLGATGRRRPYVLTLYGHDVTGLLTTAPGHYERVVERVDAVIVLSAFLRDAAIRAGFRARDISIIPIGLDTSYFTPSPLPDGPPVVAYVGRLVEKKGLDVLLQAWPRIRDAVPAATLRVLGEGGLEHLLTPTDSSVTHIRPNAGAPRAQVRDVIRQATVVVTPSRTAASGDSESLLLVNL
jgi:glucosyltransferase